MCAMVFDLCESAFWFQTKCLQLMPVIWIMKFVIWSQWWIKSELAYYAKQDSCPNYIHIRDSISLVSNRDTTNIYLKIPITITKILFMHLCKPTFENFKILPLIKVPLTLTLSLFTLESNSLLIIQINAKNENFLIQNFYRTYTSDRRRVQCPTQQM
jgi:hypothetical protein